MERGGGGPVTKTWPRWAVRWPRRAVRWLFASFHKLESRIFSKCGPTTAAWTSPGNLLQMHILSPHPDLLNHTAGSGAHTVWFTLPPGDTDML